MRWRLGWEGRANTCGASSGSLGAGQGNILGFGNIFLVLSLYIIYLFSFDLSFGVVPDIVTVGKSLGNGHPMGAVICSREVARNQIINSTSCPRCPRDWVDISPHLGVTQCPAQ